MTFVNGRRALVLLVTLSAIFSLLEVASTAAAQDATASPPGKRIGLVIGNDAYPSSPIGTAVTSAKAMAALLHDGGFDVVYAENARRAEIQAAIKQFSQKVHGGDTAFVYFAGHAVQSQERNFLVPIDATISSDADVRSQAVDIDLVLDPLIVDRPKGAVVILDATRNNPWQKRISPQTNGLANVGAIHGITQVYPARR
jgi:uncharacterized caspase-like protein